MAAPAHPSAGLIHPSRSSLSSSFALDGPLPPPPDAVSLSSSDDDDLLDRGIASMSSRRPSYAAEFASRPRGLSDLHDSTAAPLTPSSSHPAAASVDRDRWGIFSSLPQTSAASAVPTAVSNSAFGRSIWNDSPRSFRSLSFSTGDAPSPITTHRFPAVISEDAAVFDEEDDYLDYARFGPRPTEIAFAAPKRFSVPNAIAPSQFRLGSNILPPPQDPALRRYSFSSPSDIPLGSDSFAHPQFGHYRLQHSSVLPPAAINTLATEVGSLSLGRLNGSNNISNGNHTNTNNSNSNNANSNAVNNSNGGATNHNSHNHDPYHTNANVVVMPNPSAGNAFYRQLASEVDPYFSSAEDVSMNKSRSELFNAFSQMHATASQQPRTAYNSANGVAFPSTQRLYCVQFKGGRLDVFYVPEGSGLGIKAGDLVIVDADRGKDLGKVTHEDVSIETARELKTLQHNEQQAALQQNSFDDSGNAKPLAESGMTAILQPKQIIRFAQPIEIQQLFVKKADEEKAQKVCMAKVEERGMPMQIRDAEYQWDRRKLTFFYTASHRIDFRDLVRDLFRIYKTRIWMCAVST